MSDEKVDIISLLKAFPEEPLIIFFMYPKEFLELAEARK